MSSFTTEPRTTWQQIGEPYASTQSRVRQREHAARGSQTSLSLVTMVRLWLQCVWLLLYSVMSLVGMVTAIALAVLVIPILIFGPVFLVALALGAATQVFRAFGLA